MRHRRLKTANKKEATFQIKYQESYLNYGFIAIHKPALCNMWRPAIRRSHETFKDLGKKKKCEHERQKATALSADTSNVSALRALFLVANRMGRVDPGCC